MNELVVDDDGNCNECSVAAVNVKDQRRIADDIQAMKKDCPKDAPSAQCFAPLTDPACVSNRCALVAQVQDAGVD